MDKKGLERNGNVFELRVCRYLHSRYGAKAVVLHNREVWSEYLGTDTQIDVILILPKGVFVIEAKGWRDWVRGEYNDFHWKGKSLHPDIMRVFSPVYQNFIHIRSLRNAIRKVGVEPPYFHNLVCFPDGTSIQSNCREVCNLSNLGVQIDELCRISTLNLNVERVTMLIEKVCSK